MRPTRRALLLAPAVLALPRGAVAEPADVYADLLAQEHAAVHLYGVISPRLPESLRDRARAAYDDHRRHRDRLVELVSAAGGTPAPPRLTYAVPGSVATGTAARAAAVAIEDSLALRWHAALAEVAPPDRAVVATALGDEAEHLAYLRFSATGSAKAAAVPFPGR